jgi:hypothetical protein
MDAVVAYFDNQFYPSWMDQVRLELRAYLDDSFSITYREEWAGQAWMCRWDRHENPHSSRDHFHEPPDARTEDAVDRDFPDDYMRVLEIILEFVDERLGTVWEIDR